jgi:two-component system, chemotaxis family, sensor kinase CheA
MNEFVEQFLIEGRELVAQGNNDLLALEEHPDDKGHLDGAFRAFHTLKGAAGIVDFTAMGRALHAAEDVLSAVRAGNASVTSALIDLCLACLDQVNAWLDQIQSSGENPADAEGKADELVGRFGALNGVGSAPIEVGDDERGEAQAAEGATSLSTVGYRILEAQKLLLAESSAEDALGRLGSAGRVAANVLRHHGFDTQDLEGLLQTSLVAGDAAAMAAAIDQILARLSQQPAGTAISPSGQSRDVTLRVDVSRIDALVRLTGELLIAKNALGHSAQLAQGDTDLRSLGVALRNQHLLLDRLIGELQQSVFSLRVLPLQQVFQRFPRLVREMAATLGKPARLIIEGGTTEADKTIVEAIFEPLLHVLRNALDHGVENANERAAAGKPAMATINLRAARQGSRVVVEVEDDGGGIDIAQVRAVAARRDVASSAALADMSEDEVVDLIFAPGFSTASQVTDLSGRGVGMDVVRTTVEWLGGRVTVASRPKQGTVVRFLLPFTVMMTEVLTVEAVGQVFGVPLDAVFETVRVESTAIVPVGAGQALVVRNRTIPVIDLGRALGYSETPQEGEANVLIVSIGGQLGGLKVDRLGDRLGVMLKPPEGLLAGVPGIDGTTLLGDGRVLIVLDLNEVFDNAGT